MIVVAFHFRLPDDPKGQPEGCWKEFSREPDAHNWLSGRVGKSLTSPQGKFVAVFPSLKFIPSTPDKWPDYSYQVPSFQKAIVSYCRYKAHDNISRVNKMRL